MKNVEQTIQSEYANSPTLLQLIYNMNEYIDPRADIKAFYDNMWNINTAVGRGLDNWGRIVGLPNGRLLQLGANEDIFGFKNSDVPPDWAPFNQGTFYTGHNSTTTFSLDDDPFRTLILAKALSNISVTTSPALNQLLQNLFPNRGVCYVIDRGQSNTAVGGMIMTFYFQFALSQVEYAILTQSGALPHPTGVGYNVVVILPDQIGFIQAPPAAPLSQGTLFVPGTVV